MATFASTGMKDSSQDQSNLKMREKMLSENNEVTSPRGSREVQYSMPKKTVHYNYQSGSKDALKHRLALQSSNDTDSKNLAPFKNGTQMSFKGEPLQSPLYQSDKNTNFQSQTSMPRQDDATNPSEGMQAPGLINSFTNEQSIRRNSIGLESKE